MELLTPAECAEVAAGLRRLVEASGLESSPTERAYLAGAVAVLEQLAAPIAVSDTTV